MNQILLKTLISPDGNPLIYDEIQNKLIDKQLDNKFEIKNGIPILLPKDAEERWMEVTLTNGVRARIFTPHIMTKTRKRLIILKTMQMAHRSTKTNVCTKQLFNKYRKM